MEKTTSSEQGNTLTEKYPIPQLSPKMQSDLDELRSAMKIVSDRMKKFKVVHGQDIYIVYNQADVPSISLRYP